MNDKLLEKVAREIALMVSNLGLRVDDYALGRRVALREIAEVLGLNFVFTNIHVCVRSADGAISVQV